MRVTNDSTIRSWFTGSGTNISLQYLERRIITEWLPFSGFEYGNALDIKHYMQANLNNAENEYWLSIQPKRRNNMVISNIKATFPTTIENVWAIVTSLTDYSWRSDIDKIEVVNDTTFIEYSKTGIATTFTITVCKPLERWEFDMENKNMKGHWVGIFKPKNGYVEIDFTENVSAKKFLLKPFVKTYLKKQQSTYVRDLGKALADE